ncbi:hypothetical protein [Anoxynatronum buryatiense]|uniref:Uncharacterized protein n=1 Tax=Anoxynatronum buryatiense TaxID=489973 RepID=A0AA46AJS3_9CLOT|nr:hypothetical protein [Anoxynatronum buryatiense]SMP64122.1 hypothetical protein SAMN06296020_111104 [Anoxynatronum buryatiense]
MKMTEIINQFFAAKVIFIVVSLCVVGLFITGVVYGDVTIIAGTVLALVALYKYRRQWI